MTVLVADDPVPRSTLHTLHDGPAPHSTRWSDPPLCTRSPALHTPPYDPGSHAPGTTSVPIPPLGPPVETIAPRRVRWVRLGFWDFLWISERRCGGGTGFLQAGVGPCIVLQGVVYVLPQHAFVLLPPLGVLARLQAGVQVRARSLSDATEAVEAEQAFFMPIENDFVVGENIRELKKRV